MARGFYRRWAHTTRSGKKYGNVKAEVDGKIFDSRKEARRFIELQMLLQAGAISELETQKKYILIPAQREPDTVGPRGGVKPGKVIEKAVYYVADFVYKDNATGETIVEDTKGKRTKEYILKRKMLLFFRGIRIREV